jgi:hypothetical protein
LKRWGCWEGMEVSVKNIWEVCEFEDEVIYGNPKAGGLWWSYVGGFM